MGPTGEVKKTKSDGLDNTFRNNYAMLERTRWLLRPLVSFILSYGSTYLLRWSKAWKEAMCHDKNDTKYSLLRPQFSFLRRKNVIKEGL